MLLDWVEGWRLSEEILDGLGGMIIRYRKSESTQGCDGRCLVKEGGESTPGS